MLDSSQMGRQSKSGPILWAAFLPIVSIVIAVVGILLFSSDEPAGSFWHRSDLFWVRLAWFELLVAVTWLFGVIVPIGGLLAHRQQVGGSFPVMSAAVLNAAALSLLVLLVSTFLPETRFFKILPVVVQLVIIIVCLAKITFVKQAQDLQNDGVVPIPRTLKSPEELCAFLVICESQPSLAPELAKKLKGVRERIKYSVPRVGKVASSSHYESVVRLVDTTYDQMMSGRREEIGRSLESLDSTITLLISECKN